MEGILFVGDGETHDAGLAVEGLRGVEDEVADAVVDLVAVIVALADVEAAIDIIQLRSLYILY